MEKSKQKMLYSLKLVCNPDDSPQCVLEFLMRLRLRQESYFTLLNHIASRTQLRYDLRKQ